MLPSHAKPFPPKLWLASQSPRRRHLLEATGLAFEAVQSNAPESELVSGSVEATVLENALRKGQAVLNTHAAPDDIVLAADTLVALGEVPLSKPPDRAAAIRGLKQLSGKTHRVLTGFALLSLSRGTRTACVETLVTFRCLSQQEIDDYADTDEPYDKAGGYGIQGLGSLLVESIQGSYPNVVGLPIDSVLRELATFSGVPATQWLS